MNIKRAVFALLAALTSFGFAMPANAGGDVTRGEAIAKRWCVNCHVVSPEQTTAKVDVPTFADIARRRPDDRALSSFLVKPHPPMPDLSLTRQEIEDVVAYIRSLDPSAPPAAPAKKERVTPPKG